MKWVVTLAGGRGPDVWINEENTVEAEDIKEAVGKAIELVEYDEDLSIRNIVGIDLA
jgi:hypothetical protein